MSPEADLLLINEPRVVIPIRIGISNLIYCCSLYNTVNKVVADKTSSLISLKDWSPRGVCIKALGDMLVTMTHNLEHPSKETDSSV